MLEGIVQIVCPHCDQDNRIPRERLRDAPPCVACRNALFEGRPAPLDDERRFHRHARHNDIPVLSLFHTASADADSAAAREVLQQAAPQLEPYTRLLEIDSAALPDLAASLKVVRDPTWLMLHHERELGRAAGAMNLAQLLAWARPLVARVPGRLPQLSSAGANRPTSARQG
jgi:thioredoxin 2